MGCSNRKVEKHWSPSSKGREPCVPCLPGKDEGVSPCSHSTHNQKPGSPVQPRLKPVLPESQTHPLFSLLICSSGQDPLRLLHVRTIPLAPQNTPCSPCGHCLLPCSRSPGFVSCTLIGAEPESCLPLQRDGVINPHEQPLC